MRVQWGFLLSCVLIAIIAFPLTCCTDGNPYHQPVSKSMKSSINSSFPMVSASRFSFSNGSHTSSPLYTIHASTPFSKLRHGHQEFTINLAQTNKSLIIAFIGYTGPASYTITNSVNGGDVRITLGQQFWDLSLIPTASCSLTIFSDIPTEQVGLHRMQGRFSCPVLPLGGLTKPTPTVAITNGAFDVLIIVES